jgi:hypothetical protein
MRQTQFVLEALARSGVLLKQDKALPNVVSLVLGESLNTSWWSHPKASVVFSVLSELADHEDVLFTKLVAKKDTLVHRALWPALPAVGKANSEWQLDGLTSAAKELLARVTDEKEVQAAGSAAKELQLRLLVTAREVHTASGRHEMVLESWERWCKRTKTRALASPRVARQRLEEALTALGGTRKQLPWGASA